MSEEIREPDLELLTRYRRDLHRIPELDFDLDETLAYVLDQLRPLEADPRVRVFSPCRSTLCCLFDRGTERACAVRTDMDALPVTERTGVAFQSEHAGRMHACGHDGHMAMALGLARHLALHLDELPRSVLVVFQPAEETTGGAKVVCESGVFERLGVDRIFGFHLWPDLPAGQVASRPGALLAASNEVDVAVRGVSSHIAKAEQGRDALEAAAHVLLDCYAYMDERRTEEPCLMRFGHATSGTVRNQVSDLTRLEGSLRTFSVAMGERCRRELPEVAAASAARLGCAAEVRFSEGYPPVTNDEVLFGLVASAVPGLVGLAEPLLIAEDFAWYQRYLPGVFLLLGTGTGTPLHSDAFDFDEAVLMRGLEVYERLVRIA
ncbi:amidohydrolase [Atopobiaceae bacterium HCP3S3_F7]